MNLNKQNQMIIPKENPNSYFCCTISSPTRSFYLPCIYSTSTLNLNWTMHRLVSSGACWFFRCLPTIYAALSSNMNRLVNLYKIGINHFDIRKRGFILLQHYEFFDVTQVLAMCLFDFYLELELDDQLTDIQQNVMVFRMFAKYRLDFVQ